MRIAYLTQSYPPTISGAALFARRLAEAMSKRGHPVLVIAPSDSGRRHSERKGNLHVLRLPSYRNPLRARQRFMIYPRRDILQALQMFKPEIMHAHDNLQISLIGLAYVHRTGIPIITTTHQLPWFIARSLPDIGRIRALTEAALWIYARWLLKRYTHVVTPTQTIANIVSKITGIPAQPISCGIDLETFYPPRSPDEKIAARVRLNLPTEKPIILHVGQLHSGKLVERVLEAAAQAMTGTEAHLLVVGDGPEKQKLLRMCQSLGIAERVHFPGFLSLEEGLADVYGAANLFVTASEIETQGLVLLEAAASGLPIVAARATCIPEIVHDGVNGFLTEPGDVHAMAEKMRLLLSNPQKARTMGESSVLLASEHEISRTMERHERLYLQLIKETAMLERDKILSRRQRSGLQNMS